MKSLCIVQECNCCSSSKRFNSLNSLRTKACCSSNEGCCECEQYIKHVTYMTFSFRKGLAFVCLTLFYESSVNQAPWLGSVAVSRCSFLDCRYPHIRFTSMWTKSEKCLCECKCAQGNNQFKKQISWCEMKN